MKSIKKIINESMTMNESFGSLTLNSLDSKDQDRIWKAVRGEAKKQIEDFYKRIWKVALLDRTIKPQVKLIEAIFGKQNLSDPHSK